jgi:Zn-dependent protease
MKWSWKIGRLAGIDIFIHATFLMLLAWIGLSEYFPDQNISRAASGIGFSLCLFSIVVLHELGHCLTARRFGIRTRDITLLPIGGVARLERIPEDPRQELLVALAGPAVNVVLALILFGLLAAGNKISGAARFGLMGGSLAANLMWINVSLALFNMLPAFPMDGGRVLRAVLAMKMNHAKATTIAARVGQGMAVVLGLAGFHFENPVLVFIAVFVWVGAARESGATQVKSALTGLHVGRVMITAFGTLTPGEPLARAVEHVLSGYQHDFPVVENGQLLGILTRDDLLTGLARHGQSALVRDVMQRKVRSAGPMEMVEEVWARLGEDDCRTIPVVHENRLVGILTSENLGEYLMFQAALANPRRGG